MDTTADGDIPCDPNAFIDTTLRPMLHVSHTAFLKKKKNNFTSCPTRNLPLRDCYNHSSRARYAAKARKSCWLAEACKILLLLLQVSVTVLRWDNKTALSLQNCNEVCMIANRDVKLLMFSKHRWVARSPVAAELIYKQHAIGQQAIVE